MSLLIGSMPGMASTTGIQKKPVISMGKVRPQLKLERKTASGQNIFQVTEYGKEDCKHLVDF